MLTKKKYLYANLNLFFKFIVFKSLCIFTICCTRKQVYFMTMRSLAHILYNKTLHITIILVHLFKIDLLYKHAPLKLSI